MTYRDENEALRARVEQLEGELAVAHDAIARLRGEGASDGAAQHEGSSRGAPVTLVLERQLDFELDEKGYEAIAAVVRARLGVEVAQVGRTLSTRGDVFSLRREGGATVIRMRGQWRSPRRTMIGAGSVTTAFFALPFIGVAADLAVSSGSNLPFALLALAPILGGGAALLARRHAKRLLEQNVETHRGVFATVLALAEEHALRAPPTKVRVGGERGSDSEHEQEEVVLITDAADVRPARSASMSRKRSS